MVNVVIGKKRTIQVSANNTAGIIDSTNPVTLKNSPITPVLTGAGAGRLDSLADVNASGEVDNATLVYNAATDTYEVKKLEFSNINGDLDGGTF